MAPTTRLEINRGPARAGCLVLCLAAITLPALSQAAQRSAVELDHVVATVNRRVILASDIDEEIRLSVLDPVRTGQGTLTPRHALDQLISRALIEQQIRREDMQSAEPAQTEVDARLADLRKELPACIHQNCATDAGWNAFLAAHQLTPARAEAYARYRIQILDFIEQRFRPGIRITQQEIEDYYNKTLLPLYSIGEAVPTLEKVSPRIEEILLQQQVNVLFDDWLTNLRKQGDIEVLDPALLDPPLPAPAPPAVMPPSSEGKGSQ